MTTSGSSINSGLAAYRKLKSFLGHQVRQIIGKPVAETQSKLIELQMVWNNNPREQMPSWEIPGGYILRTYQPDDEFEFFGLMERAGYPGWNMPIFESWRSKILPDGFFFLIDTITHSMVATAMACDNPTALHPLGGSLSCVAADPVYRGKGLGLIVSAAVTWRLLLANYTDIYLETDDWRLAAIKTYLKMGWVPFIFADGMLERWQAIYATLNLSANPHKWQTATPFENRVDA